MASKLAGGEDVVLACSVWCFFVMVEQRKIVCHVGDKGEGDGEWGVGQTKRMGGCVLLVKTQVQFYKRHNGPMHEMSVTEKVEANLFDKM